MRDKIFKYLLYIMSLWGTVSTLILLIVINDFSERQNNTSDDVNDIEQNVIGIGFSCPKNISLVGGMTWRGITVGESSLIELNDLYGVIATHRRPSQPLTEFADVYEISLTRAAAQSRHIAQGAKACLINNTIAALYLSVGFDSELPDVSYVSWKDRYGEPDIVTWSASGDWYRRTILWNSEGVAIDVDITGFVDSLLQASVNGVVFFPPSNEDDLSSLWPYIQLKDTPPNSDPPAENLASENPF